jgi:hypothetical protein
MFPALDRQKLAWFAIAFLLVVGPVLAPQLPWIRDYPQELVLPITRWFNDFMIWFVAIFGAAFQVITALLVLPIRGMQALLNWLPWPLTIALASIVAHRASAGSSPPRPPSACSTWWPSITGRKA